MPDLALPQPLAMDRLTYQTLLAEMRSDVAQFGLRMGRNLTRIHDAQAWTWDGYSNFRDFAKGEFNMVKSTAYNMMTYARIYDKADAWRLNRDEPPRYVPTARHVRDLVERFGEPQAIETVRGEMETGRRTALPEDPEILSLAAGDDAEDTISVVVDTGRPPVVDTSDHDADLSIPAIAETVKTLVVDNAKGIPFAQLQLTEQNLMRELPPLLDRVREIRAQGGSTLPKVPAGLLAALERWYAARAMD